MLYRSEVQTARWGFGNVYSAPNRNWGYNRMFAQGFRPPLDIGPRTYQRTGFQELTRAEFEAAVAAIKAAYQ